MVYVFLILMVFERRSYILKSFIIKYKPFCGLSLVPSGLRLCLNRNSDTGNATQVTSTKEIFFYVNVGVVMSPSGRK